MTIIISLIAVAVFSYYLSDYIKRYRNYLYIIFAVISIMSSLHALFILNGYSVTYITGLKQFMKAIDSGALGGAFFILVMYIGVFDMKKNYAKKFRRNRAELSILACIITLPHNFHYFFSFVLGQMNISEKQGITLWANLMMFTSAVFAICIMLPLFITSFTFFKKKMHGKVWKNLQEYAYIFYAMLFIQIIMVYITKPSSIMRNIDILFYSTIFISYTIQKIKIFSEKRKIALRKSNNSIVS